MDVNELLDTIDEGLRDVQKEILENLNAKAKAQRTKPIEARLQDLEMLMARMKWEVSGLRSKMKVAEMRWEASQRDLSKMPPREPRRKRG